MIGREKFIYKEETYLLLLSEETQIWKSSNFFGSTEKNALKTLSYYGMYALEGFQLLLNSIQVPYSEQQPEIKEIKPRPLPVEEEKIYMEYDRVLDPLTLTGALVIAKDFVNDFGLEEEYPCFCYRNVLELIFENGRLVTTIDHSKAMVRIRKNLVRGLRSLRKGKDSRCIRQFLKSSLVGNYRSSFKKKAFRLLKRKKTVEKDS